MIRLFATLRVTNFMILCAAAFGEGTASRSPQLLLDCQNLEPEHDSVVAAGQKPSK
jgi:hypothetical protein